MRRSKPRPGFTLIELLVVIVILGLLVGLLVPAVMRAVGTARDASVAAEIQAISQALAAFKSQYNEYPPSRIICSENGDYSPAGLGGAGTVGAALGPRTVAALKRYWPRISLNTSGTKQPAPGVSGAPGGFYDFNGNGNLDPTPYILTGSECLVFFLGGVPQATGNGSVISWSMTGFSKNPTNPFQNSTVTANRTAPLYEFNNGRLQSNALNGTLPNPPGFPGYLDSLGGTGDANVIPFYAYFSAYGGAGYDPDDCDQNELDAATGNNVVGAFPSSGAAYPNPPKITMPGYCWSPSPNPYTSTAPVPTTGATGSPDSSNKKPRAWLNANSFQLFSAGRDRAWGIGGQYWIQRNEKLPFVTTSPGDDTLQSVDANFKITGVSLGTDVRYREQDNIANFSQGRLE